MEIHFNIASLNVMVMVMNIRYVETRWRNKTSQIYCLDREESMFTMCFLWELNILSFSTSTVDSSPSQQQIYSLYVYSNCIRNNSSDITLYIYIHIWRNESYKLNDAIMKKIDRMLKAHKSVLVGEKKWVCEQNSKIGG